MSNWDLLPENSHYLQRIGISLSEDQADINVPEVVSADDNVHATAWDKTADFNARDEYLQNAVMYASSTFLNDLELPTRLTLRLSMLPFETDTTGENLIPSRHSIVQS